MPDDTAQQSLTPAATQAADMLATLPTNPASGFKSSELYQNGLAILLMWAMSAFGIEQVGPGSPGTITALVICAALGTLFLAGIYSVQRFVLKQKNIDLLRDVALAYTAIQGAAVKDGISGIPALPPELAALAVAPPAMPAAEVAAAGTTTLTATVTTTPPAPTPTAAEVAPTTIPGSAA